MCFITIYKQAGPNGYLIPARYPNSFLIPNPIQFTFEYHRVLHYISGIPDIFGKPDMSGNPKYWVHPNTTGYF